MPIFVLKSSDSPVEYKQVTQAQAEHRHRRPLTAAEHAALIQAGTPKKDPQWHPEIVRDRFPASDWLQLPDNGLDSLIAADPDPMNWKIDNNSVVVKTVQEREAGLVGLRRRRYSEIDKNTADLIGEGFIYPAFDPANPSGYAPIGVFSLSNNAQKNLIAWYAARNEAIWPIELSFLRDDHGTFEITNATVCTDIYLTAMAAIQYLVGAGEQVKALVRTAVSRADVENAVDPRLVSYVKPLDRLAQYQ